ncbi:MAG: menaquinone-specific isochorismate synthase [Actinomycetota bacterium]|nr:menaquinone-specific isochorismate synthase [Actinomycetota bacterium]
MTLVARTRRLDRDVELLAVAGRHGVLFEQHGHGFAGRGEALRIATAEGVEDALASIEVDDEVDLPGTGPVAFGALAFHPPGGALVVPAIIVGKADDGTRWITTVGETEHQAPLLAHDAALTAPSTFTVRPGRPPAEWCDAVASAVAAMHAGELTKVVLAREVVVEADEPIDIVEVLRRLRAAYPSAMVFAVDGFIGASPELLVSRMGDVVRSQPMAGTTPRTGDPATDARLAASLLASAKDRAEHQITIDTVLDAVLPFCSYVDSEPEPSIVTLANVQHLASLVEGRLSSPPASVLSLVAALHPTPAVCGFPRAAALEVIARLEGFGRGRYAGTVGWVDRRGNGRFAVSIRCAEVEGRSARLFAGNGIVADSDPQIELAETRAKLNALLSALVRP